MLRADATLTSSRTSARPRDPSRSSPSLEMRTRRTLRRLRKSPPLTLPSTARLLELLEMPLPLLMLRTGGCYEKGQSSFCFPHLNAKSQKLDLDLKCEPDPGIQRRMNKITIYNIIFQNFWNVLIYLKFSCQYINNLAK